MDKPAPKAVEAVTTVIPARPLMLRAFSYSRRYRVAVDILLDELARFSDTRRISAL